MRILVQETASQLNVTASEHIRVDVQDFDDDVRKLLYDLFDAISAYIDPCLENIEQFLNGFVNPPDEIDMDDLEPDDESVVTPFDSHFLDLDDDSDDGEVLNG
ncbi:hypothetical protein Tco_0491453 [Tanacetum coccineum]